MRSEGRAHDQLRDVRFHPGYIPRAPGSVLIEQGRTRVICTATVEESVPTFLEGKGTGWITCEYAMLPGSTRERTPRDATRGKVNGRGQEIQRIIGRSLRAVVDRKRLGERTVWLDCDVIEADGGTRTASITGAFVALGLAVRELLARGVVTTSPLRDYLAAVSVGLHHNVSLLDLDYSEDAHCDVDLNVVMTGRGKYVEIQGTAEGDPFDRAQLVSLLDLAGRGIEVLLGKQRELLGAGVVSAGS